MEEFEEVGMVLLADALELEDFSEVGVRFVGNVDEIGLHEGFRGGRPHLERFEDGVQACHGLRDAFNVVWGWRG